jgi:hypothetical protein
MAAEYNINIDQGASFIITLSLKDSANDPINLTGINFRGKIKRSLADASSLADFSFNILNQTTDTGKVEVTLSATQTAALPAPASGVSRTVSKLIYDIESVDGSGFVRRWLQGLAIVSPEVTK